MKTARTTATKLITKQTFDDWRVLSVAIYMALLGYAVLVGIPVISTAWVEQLQFTEIQVGRLASADLGGLALGSIIASFLIRRIDRWQLTLLAIALAASGNFFCLYYLDYESVLILRLIAGTGSGIYTAIAIAMLGATSNPARSFNILLFAFAFTQAAELRLLPEMTMKQIYLLFMVLYLLTILLLKWIPKTGLSDAELTESEINTMAAKQPIINLIPWLILTAIFFTYICIGAYWTYIELANIDAGLDREYINTILVWASFMSIIGCVFATIVSHRFGMLKPLILALCSLAGVVSLMIGDITNSKFFISLFLLNFLWIFIDVYQMGSMSIIDKSSRFVTLMPAAQGAGQIFGPLFASYILERQLGYHGVFIMCSVAALCAMLVYAYIYYRIHRQYPALTEMSDDMTGAI